MVIGDDSSAHIAEWGTRVDDGAWHQVMNDDYYYDDYGDNFYDNHGNDYFDDCGAYCGGPGSTQHQVGLVRASCVYDIL